MSSTLTWGTTPATPPDPGLDPADGLQPLVDAIAAAASGGVIELPNGTFYADPGNPSTPLTIPAAAYNLTIRGTTEQGTIIGSPILCQAGKLRLSDMHIDPPAGSAYGVKVYNGGSPFLSRINMDHVIIGDRAQVYTNGPTNGFHIDGAGIILCSNCTFAFCAGNGFLADSTGVEPNTALLFQMCSFVGNGQHGVKLMQSCSIAEFQGGNSEQNGRSGGASSAYRELYAESMNCLILHGFDFETNPDWDSSGRSLDNAVEVNSCRPVIIDGCNFLTPTGKGNRSIIMSSSNSVRVKNCFFGGLSGVAVARFDGNCSGVEMDGTYPTDCFVEDYSR